MSTVVIGAGIAGLTSALMAHSLGEDVRIVTVGFGGLQLGNGTLDVLGVEKPFEGIATLPDTHPYAKIDPKSLEAGIAAFTGYVPMEGNASETVVFPTALGALRRTSFYPASYAAGKIEKDASYLIVGFTGLKDFYPALCTENLVNQGINARCETIDFRAKGDISLQYSRTLLEDGKARELGEQIKAIVKPGERVGIPAVAREEQWREIQEAAGVPVFQIPIAPPSIFGLEANERLRAACQAQRVDIMLNGKAVGLVAEGSKVTGVRVQVAGSVKTVRADHVIYAGGGLDSGAILFDSYNNVVDTVFGLPVYAPEADTLVHGDLWGPSQPLYEAGLIVDEDMRPLGEDGTPAYTNLYAVGGMIGGAQRHREKSGEGIALGSAAQAVAAIERSMK